MGSFRAFWRKVTHKDQIEAAKKARDAEPTPMQLPYVPRHAERDFAAMAPFAHARITAQRRGPSAAAGSINTTSSDGRRARSLLADNAVAAANNITGANATAATAATALTATAATQTTTYPPGPFDGTSDGPPGDWAPTPDGSRKLADAPGPVEATTAQETKPPKSSE